ncbi:MAG: TonB-dependent receptor, partial [Rhodothermales bacterium]|nr:TonB-dependent receptor [Rhodothermales bacterium]
PAMDDIFGLRTLFPEAVLAIGLAMVLGNGLAIYKNRRGERPKGVEGEFRPGRYHVPRSARAVVSRSGARWSYSVSATIRAGYPETVPTSRYSLGSPIDEQRDYLHRPKINNGRLPAYARLDVQGGYRFGWLGAAWRVRLHLYNVTNRDNILGRQYSLSGDEVKIVDRGGLPLLPLFEIEIVL